jgi:ribonucleoside-diphosphate reductase beta chain
VIAAPRHFAALAGRLRWDPAAIDLGPDASAWRGLPAERRARLSVLLAGFHVAEDSVSQELAPFAAASGHPDTAAAFAAQRADEERHAALFDRFAEEVLGLPGDGPRQRRAAGRRAAPPALLELFERRLPAVSAALAQGRAGLAEAVGVYHMILEGVVLSAGLRALLEELADGALPGVRTGVELVERDERWHVGLGLRCLRDLRADPALVGALLTEGEAAAATWGEAVPAHVRARAVAMHRRRLGEIGLAGGGRTSSHAAAGSRV